MDQEPTGYGNNKYEFPVISESKREINQQIFANLPRDFNFMTKISPAPNIEGVAAGFSIINGEQVIRLQLPGETERSFPERKTEQTENLNERQDYTIDGLNMRKTEFIETKEISIDEAVEMVSQTQGSEIMFYTGAGISKGGDKPVWDMNQVADAFGLNGDASLFVKYFQNDPEELLERVQIFKEQLFADSSTPAHEAIAKIVDKKPGSLVITENIDLKHEAKESRLSVVHAGSNNCFEVVKQKSEKIKLLITAGLSHDDRAIIQYLKTKNPDIRILCLALNKYSIPDYLDNNDRLVIGDAQEKLPLIAESL